MPTVDIYNIKKEKVAELDLGDRVFGAEVNEAAICDVVRMQLAARRRGTAATKERGDIRGGGKKPWRQKGTGRARAGTSRSPLWRGGGTIFGPHPRDFSLKVSKKVRKLALISALSMKVKSGKLQILRDFPLAETKTKKFREVMDLFQWIKALIVIDQPHPALELSSRNVPGVKVMRSEGVNVYDLLDCDEVVFLEASVKRIEEVLSGNG